MASQSRRPPRAHFRKRGSGLVPLGAPEETCPCCDTGTGGSCCIDLPSAPAVLATAAITTSSSLFFHYYSCLFPPKNNAVQPHHATLVCPLHSHHPCICSRRLLDMAIYLDDAGVFLPVFWHSLALACQDLAVAQVQHDHDRDACLPSPEPRPIH